MAISHYAVKLSPHMAETPEEYLLFFDAVIGRTGIQTYKGNELPADELAEQGITVAHDDSIDVYRSPDEVFSPKTIASFQMKSITDGHPDALLTSDTVADHELGQIFNVRKGAEPMEDGNWALLADGIIKDKNLVLKIKAGLRELSCGYNYHVIKDGNRILQVDIIGNHVAVVPNGRAGPLAAIQDAAPAVEKKWEIPMNKLEMKKMLVALGFKSFAATAEPAQLVVAMDAMGQDSEHGADCSCKDCKPASKDAAAGDARKSMHDALDKLMDSKEEEQKAAAASNDEAMDALMSLLGGGAKDAAPASEEGEKEDTEPAKDADPDDEQEETEEETPATDEAVQSEASPVIEPEARTKPDVPAAVDAAFKAGQDSVLKALKPFVATSKDKRLKGAFDTATKLTRSAVKPAGRGSYSQVVKAAAVVGKDHNIGEDPYKAANEAYKAQRAEMLKAGKR